MVAMTPDPMPTTSARTSPPDGAARYAVVTGSTAGIGRAIAAELAAAGVTVGVVARDAARGEAARAALPSAGGRMRHALFVADLSSQADVRRLATEVEGAFPQLHGLVNAAGIYTRRRETTTDGLEAMFATNLLAPYLLTNLLIARLQASAPARILTLSAPSTVRLDFDDLQGERRFRSLNAFGASKAADLLFTFELARRLEGSGVTANAVHPGLARTGLMRQAVAPLRWVTWIVSRPPERVAADIAPLVLEERFGEQSGRFFKGGREIDPPDYTRDPEAARRLWEHAAALTGLPGLSPR